jgi:hypothetical protein
MSDSMAEPFAHVSRCLDLTETDFDKGIDTREMCQKLVTQIGKVAKPESGAPKLLLLFARMAQKGCDWLDGALRVDLVGDDQVTVVEVLEDAGGVRERIFPPVALQVPLSEFSRAVQRVPHMIEPLELVASSKRRMSFVGALDDRVELATAQIAESSMFGSPSSYAPPPPGPGGKLTFSLRSFGSEPPADEELSEHDRPTAVPEERPTRPAGIDEVESSERVTQQPPTRRVGDPPAIEAPDDWDALLAEEPPVTPKK